MAKKIANAVTPTATGFVIGGINQKAISMAAKGKLGNLTPAQTQGVTGGTSVIAGSLGVLLSRRESFWTRLALGALVEGGGLLGASTVHQIDRMMAPKATSVATTTTTTTTASTASDTSSASASVVNGTDPSYESVG